MTSTAHEERMAAREFVTAALYMALVLWAALLALPVEQRCRWQPFLRWPV